MKTHCEEIIGAEILSTRIFDNAPGVDPLLVQIVFAEHPLENPESHLKGDGTIVMAKRLIWAAKDLLSFEQHGMMIPLAKPMSMLITVHHNRSRKMAALPVVGAVEFVDELMPKEMGVVMCLDGKPSTKKGSALRKGQVVAELAWEFLGTLLSSFPALGRIEHMTIQVDGIESLVNGATAPHSPSHEATEVVEPPRKSMEIEI
ncbi:MAG: hypothetical protein HQM09_19340 [Candidatus Riflebacteria bacterium]|nr:hypothetical protein [Candidatus Riflebacteria bacterium]